MVQIASALRDNQAFIATLKRIVAMAEAGEIYGMVGVMDLGGGVYEYGGEGSFVTNPLLGYAAATKLAKKFL